MAHHPEFPDSVRPATAVLTRGFDPSLSLGSARPAVFRSSTYVFPSPEAAERAFDIMAGRVRPAEGERADLIYSRFSHPNAEIFEDQIVPLEAGAREAAVFNSGMAAIMTAFFTFAPPEHQHHLYGPALRRHHRPDPSIPGALRRDRDRRAAGRDGGAGRSHHFGRGSLHRVSGNAGQPDHDDDGHPARRRNRAPPPKRPVIMVDNTFLGPDLPASADAGRRPVLYSATKYLSGFSDMIAGVAIANDPELIKKIRSRRGMFGNILQPDECWMLDSRLSTVALRMNRQSKNAQRMAERCRGIPDPAGVLSHAVRGPRADPHLQGAVRLSGRAVLARFPGRDAPPPSPSCATCASRATPCRWAESRRSPAIPKPPRIPACRGRNSKRPVSATGCARIGRNRRLARSCWPISNRPCNISE